MLRIDTPASRASNRPDKRWLSRSTQPCAITHSTDGVGWPRGAASAVRREYRTFRTTTRPSPPATAAPRGRQVLSPLSPMPPPPPPPPLTPNRGPAPAAAATARDSPRPHCAASRRRPGFLLTV